MVKKNDRPKEKGEIHDDWGVGPREKADENDDKEKEHVIDTISCCLLILFALCFFLQLMVGQSRGDER